MGLSARSAANAHDLDGFIEVDDPHAFRVRNTRLGDLRVETDLRYVHPKRYPNRAIRLGNRVAAWLGTLVSPFVPRELVTAPIPVVRLSEVDEAIAILRSADASSLGAVTLDSLSLHFNIDELLCSYHDRPDTKFPIVPFGPVRQSVFGSRE